MKNPRLSSIDALSSKLERDTMNVAVCCLLLCAVCASTLAWDLFNMAATPPMGFANWNGFGCNYNDNVPEHGRLHERERLAAAGYRTMIIQEDHRPHRTPTGCRSRTPRSSHTA